MRKEGCITLAESIVFSPKIVYCGTEFWGPGLAGVEKEATAALEKRSLAAAIDVFPVVRLCFIRWFILINIMLPKSSALLYLDEWVTIVKRRWTVGLQLFYREMKGHNFIVCLAAGNQNMRNENPVILILLKPQNMKIEHQTSNIKHRTSYRIRVPVVELLVTSE